MVYKHRTKSGKVKHYQSKRAYEDSLKGMFANGYQKKMKHNKTIPLSSKDQRYAAQFIRRARRKKGKPVSRPISKRMRHGADTLPTNNIRIRLKRFAKKNIVDPKYLYYVLLHKQMQGEFGNLAHGSQNRQVLRKSDIAKIQLPVDSGDVGALNYSLNELADIIVDAKDYQPDDIVLARVHDTKTVGKPYFVSDNERMTHESPSSPEKRQYNKQIRQRVYKVISEAKEPITLKEIGEKTELPELSTKYGVRALKINKSVKTLPNLQDMRSVLYTTSSRKSIIPIKKNE